jgi:hypothetical protein
LNLQPSSLIGKAMTSIDSIRAVVHTLRKHQLPASYELPSASAAIRWRHQFYRLRQKSGELSFQGLVLTITKAAPTTIIFSEAEIGVLTVHGEAVTIEGPPTEFPDLAEELGINLGEDNAA